MNDGEYLALNDALRAWRDRVDKHYILTQAAFDDMCARHAWIEAGGPVAAAGFRAT